MLLDGEEVTSMSPSGLRAAIGYVEQDATDAEILAAMERTRLLILLSRLLLLLDEAASQLDALYELALRETITDIARETTVLVVAHRLSTVTLADRIIVLDAGVVRAVGTHDELVDLDALYRELAATQLLAVRDEEEATAAA